MTTDNWAGFGNDKRVGRDYFVLSQKWPNAQESELGKTIVTPIEDLFRQILSIS
jgi:hypothetical protein